MEKIIKTIIKTIQKETSKEDFCLKYKSNPKDFSRTRKLTFEDVVFFVLSLSNTSFDFETESFCKNKNITVSTAALCKARDKVQYNAFRELLNVSQNEIPATNTFKGFRVIAIDGMKGELPNTPELMKSYKASKNSLYPQFHAVASFDVLNCKFIDAEFFPAPANERELAYTLLEKHKTENNINDIFLFDRGFPSVALIQKLNNDGIKFVARVQKSFIKEINEFSLTKYTDKDIHINYTSERIKASKIKNIQFPCEFDLRCVRIELPSGETEILITNLSRKEFKRKNIEKLYALRWGIETGFNHLKNAVHVEEFVGIKENSIKQEFYCALIRYNLLMQYVDEAETVAYWSKKNFKISLQD